MATPHNVELEAAKFLIKLIQESKDEPIKLAMKLYAILGDMRLNGKEHSMPYQMVSRAMEDLINEHGLDIEALKSSHVPLIGGTHVGDSSETQLAEEEDTIKTQERQHKKPGVQISIPLDEILQYSKMSLRDAAKKLEVSKHVRHSENGVENHSNIEGVSLRTPANLATSNVQESSCMSSELDEISLEAFSFHQLQQVMEQLCTSNKLCIRDSLFRLAWSAEQRHRYANLNGGSIGDRDTGGSLMAEGTNSGFMEIETDTNPIDRSIAHLLFHRPTNTSAMPAHDGSYLKSHTVTNGSIELQLIPEDCNCILYGNSSLNEQIHGSITSPPLKQAKKSSSEMLTPYDIELDAAYFLSDLNEESKDEPRKLATKHYEILEHMRLRGKKHSMPYQAVSRAMEDLINEHGLDIEALKSSHAPLTGGTHLGDSSKTQLAEEEDTTKTQERQHKKTGVPISFPLDEALKSSHVPLTGGTHVCDSSETQLAEEEDSIKTQERQHKKTGVRISIPLDEILLYSKMSRDDAAEKLGISISTLKRVCRDYGIRRWPPRDKTPQSSSVVRLGEIPQLNPDPPSNQASAGVANTKPHDTTTVRNVNVMTVKAKYVNNITIKFQVSLPLELVELGQHVAKRLDLEPGTYHIWYKDEDGDLILIGCEEDLQGYIHNSILQGSTSITLLLKPNGLAELLAY